MTAEIMSVFPLVLMASIVDSPVVSEKCFRDMKTSSVVGKYRDTCLQSSERSALAGIKIFHLSVINMERERFIQKKRDHLLGIEDVELC